MPAIDDRRAGRPRIPLNTLAIGFGVAGLAGTWSAASAALGLGVWAGQWVWILAAVVWIWLLAAHITRGVRSPDSFVSQLRQPAQGPLGALIPLVTMLLGADCARFVPPLGAAVVVASIVAAALFAAWLLAGWVQRGLPPESVHGAFFLPTVAAGFISATAASRIGLPEVAMAAFGVGVLFWVVILALLLARLVFVQHLPDPLQPTLAILVAPPAVAGIAWFQMTGAAVSAVSSALLGITVVMLLVQLFLLPIYRRITFSLGFWSFTFSFAAAGTFAIDWLALLAGPGWRIGVLVVLAAVTALVAVIAIRSVRLVMASASAERGARSRGAARGRGRRSGRGRPGDQVSGPVARTDPRASTNDAVRPGRRPRRRRGARHRTARAPTGPSRGRE